MNLTRYLDKSSTYKIFVTVPFTIALKKIKPLEINPSKYMQDLYTENYKILLSIIRGNLNKQRDTS